jgi:hypothetical protein
VATDLVQFVSLPLILFGLFIDFSHPPPPHFHVSSLSRDLSVKNNIFFWILISHRPYCITTTATTHKKNIRHQQFHKKKNITISLYKLEFNAQRVSSIAFLLSVDSMHTPIHLLLPLLSFLLPYNNMKTAALVIPNVAATPFTMRRLDHIVLRCADTQTMLDFYVGVLGKVVKINK